MTFRTGYLTIGRYGGAPVRIHWSTPIGAFVLTGVSYVPGAWLGFVLLVLAHEIGHAVMVRAFRCRVVSIDLHGLGGECAWQGYATERQRAAIAWGGVLAQALIFFTTPLWASRLSPEAHPFVAQMVEAFTASNLVLALFNLIPVRPFDGAEAWKLFRFENPFRKDRKSELRARMKTIQRKLDDLEKKPRQEPRQEGGKVIPFRRPSRDRSKLS